ncbi:hypothetical protein SDJN03_13011, partial [Cucurbita argyrosperma subsp. sororia]
MEHIQRRIDPPFPGETTTFTEENSRKTNGLEKEREEEEEIWGSDLGVNGGRRGRRRRGTGVSTYVGLLSGGSFKPTGDV